MEYKYRKTTRKIYEAIYNQYKDEFSVFESYTEMDSHGESLKAYITAWGFKGAGCPIIRIELRDFIYISYYLIVPIDQD